MKILYLDCFSGISGDMLLGALIDLGASADFIRTSIKGMGIDFLLKVKTESVHGIAAKRVSVIPKGDLKQKRYEDIKALINKSDIASEAKKIALGAFAQLAVAEAKVHGCPVCDVHFHEVGAVDSIVDVVGIALAIFDLNIKRVFSSPLPLSRGFVRTEHGTLPLPAPATLEIIKGMPVYGDSRTHELVTPTGAAILAALNCDFGAIPQMTIQKVGYGAGAHKDPNFPNLLRAVLGEGRLKSESVWIVECDIDDQSPELFPALVENVMSAGALDVSIVQAIGKKGRPKFILSAITKSDKKHAVMRAIIEHSSTFGVRCYLAERELLDRTEIKVDVRGVKVRVKVGLENGVIVKLKPEFEDCKKLATRKNITIADAIQLAIAATDRQGIRVGEKI